MKVLVTGYSGQLGYDVVREGKLRGLDMYGTSSHDLNIVNQREVSKYVTAIKPDVIMHCAAFTAVDQAENDREKCYEVNVNGTRNLVEAAKAVDAKFVYISTDYVFDGLGDVPFSELSESNPVGYYGLTKLEGEQIVQSLLNKWFIVRISWVFGVNGNNFVKTMLRLSETRDELNVVGDQIGSPTYTSDLSRLLIDMTATEKYGIYHASNNGYCSWADFAREIFKQEGKDIKVNAITSEEYPTKAVRPKNSRMSKNKLIEQGFKPLATWQDALSRYLTELKQEVK